MITLHRLGHRRDPHGLPTEFSLANVQIFPIHLQANSQARARIVLQVPLKRSHYVPLSHKLQPVSTQRLAQASINSVSVSRFWSSRRSPNHTTYHIRSQTIRRFSRSLRSAF
jgi:hypothetical protein